MWTNQMRSESNSYKCIRSCLRLGRARLLSGQERAIAIPLLVFELTVAPCVYTVPAQAQSTRTYISGKGNDSNPCTATAPCMTLQGALAKTLAGGEIYALNSANYGYVTINQAVTIVAGSDVSGVLAPSNVAGITIEAGVNDNVNLRGMDIDGAGSGASGIQFTSGAALNIQDSIIRGFTNGINFQPGSSSTLSVASTLISNNGTGIVFQSAAANVGFLNDVQLINNGTGLDAVGTNGASPVGVTLRDSVVANNSAIGVYSGGSSNVWVSNSTIVYNGTGLEAQNTGAISATGSTVAGNGTGWTTANAGQVISSSNNAISGNRNSNSAPPSSISSTLPPPSSPSPPFQSNYLIDNSGQPLLGFTGNNLTAN
jgi:hypothetical protein